MFVVIYLTNTYYFLLVESNSSFKHSKPSKHGHKHGRKHRRDSYRGDKFRAVSFKEEDYRDDDNKRFKRPMLTGVDVTSVATFHAQVKFYLNQVSAAQLSANKTKEAKNLMYSVSPVVLQYLADHGMREMNVTNNAGGQVTDVSQITSDMILHWVKLKAATSTGKDVENRKMLFRDSDLKSEKLRFQFVHGNGSLRDQLLFHDSTLSLYYEEMGMSTVMNDKDKIALYIRLLHPWALARCAVLALTRDRHEFASRAPHIRQLIESDYKVFKFELCHVITNEIGAGVEWDNQPFTSLCRDDLTEAEERQVGFLFKEALNARKNNKNAHILQKLQEKVIHAGMKKAKVKKSSTAAVSSEDEASDEESESGDSSASASNSDDGSVSSGGSDSDTDAMNDEDYNRVKMKFFKETERRGNKCTNCDEAGCFSRTCKKPCKFCSKAGCNSWTCTRRPTGYGKKENKSLPTKVRKLDISRSNQVAATICEVYETDGVLLDSGADKACITTKMLKKVEERLGSRLYSKKLVSPVRAEFANGDMITCRYQVTVPVVHLRQRSGGIVTLENVKCLLIPSELEEIILGQDVLVDLLGIDVVGLFNAIKVAHLH